MSSRDDLYCIGRKPRPTQPSQGSDICKSNKDSPLCASDCAGGRLQSCDATRGKVSDRARGKNPKLTILFPLMTLDKYTRTHVVVLAIFTYGLESATSKAVHSLKTGFFALQ